MFFNSLEFAIFFSLVFVVYATLRHRAQNRWLLFASFVFYSAWDWRFLGLIVLSTIVDYFVGSRLTKTCDVRARRRLVFLSIAVNLGILGVFKYAGFFADSFSRLMGSLGLTPHSVTLEIVLPVGISFYTFQTLSYTIDIFRKKIQPTTDFLDFALFVAFFPQLVAGPIERASRLLPQISSPRRIDMDGLREGSWLVLWGLFKKVVIGDNIAGLANAVYAPGASPEAAEVLLGTYAFAVQIYCDFSGYTDIARGIGRILGFRLMLNFNLPYLARNPSDFWRRWHISLSTWLRDYLYIPLGGNKRGPRRTYINLGLTMLLGGLWHGAAWNFVAWGGYHGLLLAVHRACRDVLTKLFGSTPPWSRFIHITSIAAMFHLTCFGWMLFRVESLNQVSSLLAPFLRQWKLGLAADWLPSFLFLVAPLVLVQAAQAVSGQRNIVRQSPFVIRVATYATLLLVIIVFGEDFGQPFIYFQF